ncbi:hypothetical protein [Actinocrispum sp. NPDC049592]|uniref:hypothetical protein n=1 Tax=Actinocrispum sp. NPDC049592 TaxID=3154835 RepID=UPI003434F057
MSKGLGLPGAFPDVLGLAVRVPQSAGPGRPVDLLLSTAGSGRLTRWLPVPRRDWSRHAVYGSIMPFRSDSGLLWIAAVPEPRSTPLPALLDALPFVVDLMLATPTSPWRAWGRLVISEHVPGMRVRFDPIGNAHPHLVPVPRALSHLRKLAYAGSQRVR